MPYILPELFYKEEECPILGPGPGQGPWRSDKVNGGSPRDRDRDRVGDTRTNTNTHTNTHTHSSSPRSSPRERDSPHSRSLGLGLGGGGLENELKGLTLGGIPVSANTLMLLSK